MECFITFAKSWDFPRLRHPKIQVAFKNATNEQAAEQFTERTRSHENKPVPMTKTRPAAPKAPNGSVHSLVDSNATEATISIEELEAVFTGVRPAHSGGHVLARRNPWFPAKAQEDSTEGT
ncbi:hypothetical protein NOF04DRAFT_1273530 [Fusarium oxysporum II5]|nr:hypothetical protein NOF04DRAFT_1273530 [Fusarium oxysporum II5]